MMAHKGHIRIEKTTVHTRSLPLRTAAYLRISEPTSEQPVESMEDQLIVIEKFLSHRPDLALVAICADTAANGCNCCHEHFQQLIEAIEDNKIDCIIVKDLSRLGQHLIEIGYYVESYFPRHSIRLISITDHLETVDGVSNLSKRTQANNCPLAKNRKRNCTLCFLPTAISDFHIPELATTYISEVMALCSKPSFDGYENLLGDQLALLQHMVGEINLQIERQKFLIDSLKPNVQEKIITLQESEELRSVFESRQTELVKIRNQLLEKIQMPLSCPHALC